MAVSQDRNIMVIGKTGNGKSSTCNTILCTNEFEEGEGGMSQTVTCQTVKKHIMGRIMVLVDTPGTLDTKDHEEVMRTLSEAMDECPEGIDAFLVVFRYDVRATIEECKAADDAVRTFGSESFKRAIAVFTHCEKYNGNKQGFLEQISKSRNGVPQLNELLLKLGNRIAMLDNRKECDAQVRVQQVGDLLSLVDDVAKHNGRRFKKEDQVTELAANNQLALISMQMQQVQAAQAAQAQMMSLEQLMMIKVMLDMHAREFGMEMQMQRMAISQSIGELEKRQLLMKLEQKSNWSCTIQ